MKTSDKDIRKIAELEDGSSVYEIGTRPEADKKPRGFYDNIADKLSEASLKKLSAELLKGIEEDIEARKDWIKSVEDSFPYLGFTLEDLKDMPFKHATRTFDSTYAASLLRFYAIARAEMLPGSGPAGYKIFGTENEIIQEQGEKRRDWLNYYLTVEDQSYYTDWERFLLYLGVYGTIFKKVYYDQLQKKPISRFISPDDFIINGDCTSILESQRLTHVLHLTKGEIILNQQKKIYRDIELSYLKSSTANNDDEDTNDGRSAVTNIKRGVNIGVYTKKSLFPVYEIHTYLNLADFEENNSAFEDDETVPLPYIVTIDKSSKEVFSIRRNWKEDDKDKKRRTYFIQYNYLPGFGIYGLGLAHIMGGSAVTLTRILRQLVDAGAFKNLPGGLKVKGMKEQETNLVVGPGQFVEIDTGSLPIRDCFMPLPYSDPSPIYRELMLGIVEQAKEMGSTTQMGMLDSKEDIPTGTIVAAFEHNNRVQSAVLKSIHYSFSQELQLIDQLFAETIESQEFSANGKRQVINAHDFTEEVQIVPISDPTVNSTLQRVMKAESILRVAQQDPAAHNMPNIFRMLYKAQGVDEQEIDNILKPTEQPEIPPVDPITEYTNILAGKPVKAAMWQNHPAHILVLSTNAQRPEIQNNPQAQAALNGLITDHQACQFIVEMQQLLGYELPPPDQLQDPQIQNTIAMELAFKLEESGATQQGQEGTGTVDPNALLMADIQQKAAETEARERIANQKAETDIFKAQLDFEKEKMKIESNEDIAELKSETELQKQEQRNPY